jgi:CubicO group peptidase (beta-lactamase class C family)
MRTSLLSAVVFLALIGCGNDQPPTTPQGPVALTPVVATSEWPASTPEAQGIDSRLLLEVVRQIRDGRHGTIHSLLIVRNRRLVLEEYFSGWSAASAHTLQSVTKSVTSLAVGLAIDRGRLRLSDTPISLFRDYEPVAALEPRKEALTVRELLMMQSGFDWNEDTYEGSPLQRLNNCRCDWVRFMVDWPMREQPGTRWQYISGNTILLGAMVGRATDQRIDQFLDEQLFAPLDVRNARWDRGSPDGLPHTGGGLYLRSRDMAKLGTVVAANGTWQDRALISSSWIAQSTPAPTFTGRNFGGQPATYGYGWWGLPQGVITASGARGQWIFILPARDLVVVSTAENTFGAAAAVRFLYSHILPAVN